MIPIYIVEQLFPELQPQYHARVYFGLGDNGQVKIGITSRPSGRRGGEMHYTELCSIPGDRKIEQEYHDRYATERFGKTEWFALSQRMLIDLILMCVQQERPESVQRLKAVRPQPNLSAG